MSRELVAYAIADTVADPIPVSACRVAEKVAKKQGIVAVAVCRHCVDGLVMVRRGDPWLHRETRIRNCREALVRTGVAHPAGSHLLERDARTQRWACPACQPVDPKPGGAR